MIRQRKKHEFDPTEQFITMESWVTRQTHLLRRRPRSFVSAFAVLIFITLSLWHFGPGSPRLSVSELDPNRSYTYRGPEAGDKVVVCAKTAKEDVSWIEQELPDWQHAIYYMNEPNLGVLHPPLNKGREAMAYLTFLIDHYSNLPSTMVFIHPHRSGWPGAWHTDADNYDNAVSIKSLQIPYVQEHGYANMRCIHEPGCPAEIQVNREDPSRTAEHGMRDAWPYMFGGNRSDIPTIIAEPCCSQFAVSKAQVLKRPLSEYQKYRQWLLDTPLDDDTSGRVMEYLWHVYFGKDPVYCPGLYTCRCEQFGRC